MYSWQFSKNFPLPKNGGHFEFLPKMAKHKFSSISLTVQDRAISSKFSTHRVSKQCIFGNFPKILLSPKMAAILNFRTFAKNGKTQICFYRLYCWVGPCYSIKLKNVKFRPPSSILSEIGKVGYLKNL